MIAHRRELKDNNCFALDCVCMYECVCLLLAKYQMHHWIDFYESLRLQPMEMQLQRLNF